MTARLQDPFRAARLFGDDGPARILLRCASMFGVQTKQLRIIYWLITGLFLVLQGWASTQYLLESPRMTETITALGYPIYFMKILGVAKLLGIVAIATGLSPTLKEWAYAGFTFDVCGAFASHLSAGDSLKIALVPVGFLTLQLASYFMWKRLLVLASLRRRHYGFGLPPREQVGSHA
jgi:DoxX-like family